MESKLVSIIVLLLVNLMGFKEMLAKEYSFETVQFRVFYQIDFGKVSRLDSMF